MVELPNVNVGIAVALDGGLIVPVIQNTDLLGLKEINQATGTIAKAARAGKLTGPQLTGGTFTISNLGMYGVREFDAILNLPQVGILAVGAAEKRAVVVGNSLQVGTVMTVNLTADHRAVDGAMAAEFLRTLEGVPRRTDLDAPLISGPDCPRIEHRHSNGDETTGGGVEHRPLRPFWHLKEPHGLRLRHRRHRRRSRRLRGGDPRGAARQEGPLHREGQARRDLPELGLHPDQGAPDQRPPRRDGRPPRQGVRLLGRGQVGLRPDDRPEPRRGEQPEQGDRATLQESTR